MDQTNTALTLPLERTIPLNPILARFFGSITTAIYFQQLYYWRGRGRRDDGFIYKSKQEIEQETTIGRRGQDNSRAKLEALGVLETKIMKNSPSGVPILHYRLNIELMQKLIDDFIKNEPSGGGSDGSDNENPVGTKRTNPIRTKRTNPNIQETTIQEITYKNNIHTRENEKKQFHGIVDVKKMQSNTGQQDTGLFDTKSSSYRGNEQTQPKGNSTGGENDPLVQTIIYLRDNKNKIDEMPSKSQRDFLYMYWNTIYRKRFNAKYMWQKPDFIILSRLLKDNPASQTLRAMEYALANNDWFIQKNGCTIKSLSYRYNELLSTKGGIYAT